jgi:ABC-2 type transport system ATP-binding protein
LKELIKIAGEKDIAVISGNFSTEQGQKIVSDLKDISVISLQEGKVVLSLEASQKMPLMLEKFFQAKIAIDDISIKQPNLESVFLKLTGKDIRE